MFELLEEKIAEQQAGKEGTAVFAVGEQLKDICRDDASATEIVLQDLKSEDMSIAECEKKIKALADERHRKLKSNSVFISPREAEEIVRKFYGLPERKAADTAKPTRHVINLDDYI